MQPAVPRHAHWLVLASATAALVMTVSYAVFHHTSESRDYALYYDVPIAVAFAAFAAERAIARGRRGSSLVDAAVVIMSLARVFVPISGYSGHVLFCTYATLSSRGPCARVISLLVLIEVVAIKLLLWGDFVTLAGGLALGLIAVSIARMASREDEVGDSLAEGGPYRGPIARTSDPKAGRTRLPLAFALACCAAVGFAYYRDRFDAARWQSDATPRDGGWVDRDRYRTARAARAAARRLRGASRNEVCEMLDREPCPDRVDARDEIRYYDLSEPCGSMFSLTACAFAVQLEGDRVVAAWLHDTDGAPWSVECLYGCDREDMRARMEPQ